MIAFAFFLLSPLWAAVASTTATPHEAALLISIAHHESGGRPEVWDCRIRGDAGRARGAWQIHPRSRDEYRVACGSLEEQAALALVRVRESLAACSHLPEPERLSMFASGDCVRGRAASRRRWVP